ncbi:hypothetical protein cyc_06655 [Cyclospora cayetanensis]|uniref:Uncharacterized protein n=1 Tax=Cyclospora cayetanensis TaxID=88456 RepID=A0A1D3D0J7_9EIME|nr:hypothetical protein cyc_06655 [Cyclospora cayetanensis]
MEQPRSASPSSKFPRGPPVQHAEGKVTRLPIRAQGGSVFLFKLQLHRWWFGKYWQPPGVQGTGVLEGTVETRSHAMGVYSGDQPGFHSSQNLDALGADLERDALLVQEQLLSQLYLSRNEIAALQDTLDAAEKDLGGLCFQQQQAAATIEVQQQHADLRRTRKVALTLLQQKREAARRQQLSRLGLQAYKALQARSTTRSDTPKDSVWMPVAIAAATAAAKLDPPAAHQALLQLLEAVKKAAFTENGQEQPSQQHLQLLQVSLSPAATSRLTLTEGADSAAPAAEATELNTPPSADTAAADAFLLVSTPLQEEMALRDLLTFSHSANSRSNSRSCITEPLHHRQQEMEASAEAVRQLLLLFVVAAADLKEALAQRLLLELKTLLLQLKGSVSAKTSTPLAPATATDSAEPPAAPAELLMAAETEWLVALGRVVRPLLTSQTGTEAAEGVFVETLIRPIVSAAAVAAAGAVCGAKQPLTPSNQHLQQLLSQLPKQLSTNDEAVVRLRIQLFSPCACNLFVGCLDGLLPAGSLQQRALLQSECLSTAAAAFDLRLWGQLQAGEIAASFSLLLTRQPLAPSPKRLPGIVNECLRLSSTAELFSTANLLFGYEDSRDLMTSKSSPATVAATPPQQNVSAAMLASAPLPKDPRTLLFSRPLLPSSLKLFAELLRQLLRVLRESAAEHASRAAAAAASYHLQEGVPGDARGGISTSSSFLETALLLASICADVEELAAQLAAPKEWTCDSASGTASPVAATTGASQGSSTGPSQLPPIIRAISLLLEEAAAAPGVCQVRMQRIREDVYWRFNHLRTEAEEATRVVEDLLVGLLATQCALPLAALRALPAKFRLVVRQPYGFHFEEGACKSALASLWRSLVLRTSICMPLFVSL